MKGGQITVFIIIAIVIVAVTALFFVLKSGALNNILKTPEKLFLILIFQITLINLQ